MEKVISVSILGIGQRGVAYANEMKKQPDKYKIVSICDINKERLSFRSKDYDVKEENQFVYEKDFFKEKRSDLLVIATQDRDHVEQAIKALELGYDILLEKPISPIKEDINRLLEAHKKYGGKILVCHVLRYSPCFEKVKEIVDSGVLGQIMIIDDIENVQYEHQSHSFVRGNWRNDQETSPMILQKCCHDLDLITWYANSKCSRVSSFGDLSFFKKENQPKGASDRCLTCKFVDSCPYSAKNVYIKDEFWGRFIITDVRPITNEAVMKALEEGPYGRCVFACDNNVVDHQIVNISFENGVIASLRMTAFMDRSGREMNIFGTMGDLYINEDDDIIELRIFGTHERKKWSIHELGDTLSSAHGGADAQLIKEMYDAILGKANCKSSLELSCESHLIALASEESRKKNGQIIEIH